MADNNGSEVSYETALVALKQKYKDKLTLLCEQFKDQLKAETHSLLGEEYNNLISERQKRYDRYRELIPEIFKVAIMRGYGETVSAISECSKKDSEILKNKAEEIERLLGEILTKIEPYEPDMVQEARSCRNDIKELGEKIGVITLNKASALSALETRVKMLLKEEIRHFIASYTIELDLLNKLYNVTTTDNNVSPFSDDDNSDDYGLVSIIGPKGTLN